MRFWKANGLYMAGAPGNFEAAQTLEKLLEKLQPGAPPEKLANAAEILEPLVGKGHEQVRQGIAS